MKSRFALVLVAVILAFLATAGSAVYLQSLKAEIKQGNEMVKVLTAQKAISPGVTVEEMLNQNMVTFTPIPRRYMVKDAITNAQGLSQKVLTVSLSKGEQLTDQKIREVGGGGLSFRIPKGLVAVAIPVDEVVGVAGQISVGDRVSLIATFSPGPGGADTSRMFLQNIQVLATSTTSGTGQKAGISQSGTALAKRTITLAVTPQDAEKLVFASEKGHVWVTLQPAGDNRPAQTSGQTVDTIFR
jgi:pilus assembly protein CpaB